MRGHLTLILSLLLCPALTGLALTGPALAEPSGGLGDRGLAPYRFNPPPQSLSPAEQGAAEAYRSQLEGRLNELQRREFEAGPLEREQLRDTRRELGRMDHLLNRR